MVTWLLDTSKDFSEAVLKLSGMIKTAATICAKTKGCLILPKKFHECVPRARSLLFEQEMWMVDNLLSEGRCANLDVETFEGYRRSLHISKGRFRSQNNTNIYGVPFLPIVHPDSHVCKLVLREVHQGSIITPLHLQDMKTLAKSRS